MILGFIGFGEAAYEMSLGLKSEGLNDIIAFDNMLEHPVFGMQIKKRAKCTNVKLVYTASEVITASDIVIIAVPAYDTLSTCETIVENLRCNQLYVDVTAASPSIKQAAAALVTEHGASFVDVAMMGVLSKFKHKVPILASGEGAVQFFNIMAPYGMRIEIVGCIPGEASGIKLIRSLCMKGMAALVVEMLEAAVTMGIVDKVIPGVCQTLNECTFEQTMDRLSIGTALHAARRAEELSGCVEMLRDAGVDSIMTQAALKKHELITRLNLKELFLGGSPEGWSQVIEAIKEQTRRKYEQV